MIAAVYIAVFTAGAASGAAVPWIPEWHSLPPVLPFVLRCRSRSIHCLLVALLCRFQREQFADCLVIIRRKTKSCVDIRALHAVFISVECFRVYLSSGSGFFPGEPGADAAFFQIVGWKGIQSGSSSFSRSSSDLIYANAAITR